MKNKIADTFLTLMENNHYSKISVKTICENVPISRTAFYHYFNNKEEIIFYFVQQDFLNNSFPIFKFHLKEKGTQTFFSYLKNHKNFYIALYKIDQGDLLFKCLKSAYRSGFDRRAEYTLKIMHKKSPIDPEIFYQYSCSGLAAVVSHWVKNNMEIPEEVIAKELYLMLEESLSTVRDYYL